MGNACLGQQPNLQRIPQQSGTGKECFADTKTDPEGDSSKYVKVSTSYDSRQIMHYNPRLPGATVSFATGNLINDIRALWIVPKELESKENENEKKKNDNNNNKNNNKVLNNRQYNGYWDEISSEIKNVKHIPYPDFGITADNLDKAQKEQGIPLLPRRWHIKDESINDESHDANCFTVLQFNMLADGLSGAYYLDPENNSKAFLNVNPRCLEWSYRGIRLVQEMLINSQWNGDTPDIIALEECDQFEWLRSYLKCYGYDGEFIAKVDSPCPSVAKDLKDEKERKTDIEKLVTKYGRDLCDFKSWDMPLDGCALFWKTSKFSVFDKNKIIRKSMPVYLSNTRPTPPNKACLEKEYCSRPNDWEPFTKIPNWNKKKEKLEKDALQAIKDNEDLLANDNNSDEKKSDPKKTKKLEKKCKKIIKDKKKLLDGLKKFDVKSIPHGKYQPILSEEKGKLLNQACTFLCVPLQWKNNKKKRFYALVSHLKSTKSREGEKVRVAQLQAIFGKGDIHGDRLLDPKKDGFDESMPILFCLDLNGKHTNTYVDEDAENDAKAREDPSNIAYCHEAYDLLSSKKIKEGGLGFTSVNILLTGKEPEFTTWKQRKDGPSKHTIDFVFVKNTEKLFSPVAHLELCEPTKREEMKNYEKHMKDKNEGLIPDWHYPSDHFSLCFRMKWKEEDPGSKKEDATSKEKDSKAKKKDSKSKK